MATLILGLGNTLMTDDGFGVMAVETLSSRYRFGAELRLLDGGTLSLDLLPQLKDVERLVIIDALQLHLPPGTVSRLEGEDVPCAFAGKLSAHQMGIPELLALAELMGQAPPELVVWGVQPENIDIGNGLTPRVAAALEPVVAGVVSDLRRWGLVATPGRREIGAA